MFPPVGDTNTQLVLRLIHISGFKEVNAPPKVGTAITMGYTSAFFVICVAQTGAAKSGPGVTSGPRRWHCAGEASDHVVLAASSEASTPLHVLVVFLFSAVDVRGHRNFLVMVV